MFHLTFGGRARDYRLHVPPAAASGKPLPLVLNLHGATQNGQLEELQSGMDASSDRDGYLVAYPDGTRIATKLTPDPVAKQAQYGWNAGYCCQLPSTSHVDDVGFLLATISDIAAHTPVNLKRVYVTGISNGGMMAYAMAAEASDHIAAIASVEGQVEIPEIHPTRRGADARVPQRRRSHREMGRRAEHRPAPALLGDGGDRPVGEGRRLRPDAARGRRRSAAPPTRTPA